ncbi:MAG: tetratricopeptide repeat protein [Bacteroidia bacterium]|nr:tetratricopeptide repeat protein [Bacteroidia bacterium]
MPVFSQSPAKAVNQKDTVEVLKIEEHTQKIFIEYPDSAIIYMERALALSEKLNYSNGMAASYGWLAYLYEQKGEIGKAIDYNRRSITLFRKLQNKKQMAACYNNIAAIFKDRGQIDSALAYHEQSLKLRREIGNSALMAVSYNNIGLIYSDQGRVAQALETFRLAQRYALAGHDTSLQGTVFQNIAFIYRTQRQFTDAFSNMHEALRISKLQKDAYSIGYNYSNIGGIFEDAGNADSAMYYHRQALAIRRKIEDKQGQAYSLKNIGGLHRKQGLADSALACFEKSLELFKEVDDMRGLANVTCLLGEIYLGQNNYPTADEYLSRSLQEAQKLGFPSAIRDAAFGLNKLYRKTGNLQKALAMHDLYVLMKDSIENDETRKAALNARYRYEYENREALLKSAYEKERAVSQAELRRQRLIRNSILAGLVAVIIFSVIFYLQRNRIKKEKNRSEELLLNILPAEVAEELKAKGSADARLMNEVTILFADFKGFTMLSEKLSPKELVAEIDGFFSAFDRIMMKHGVEKIKTIGDAYMAAGGLPVPNTSHAADVVRAAFEIQDYMLLRSEQNRDNNKPVFEVRIGIHTGPVVAGIVGVKKYAYDIWGDAVNTAARLESSGEVGKVNISETTYELVKDIFVCTPRGKVEAKNKGLIEMYFVERLSV